MIEGLVGGATGASVGAGHNSKVDDGLLSLLQLEAHRPTVCVKFVVDLGID